MSRTPDDRSLVFLSAAFIAGAHAGAGVPARLREFVSTRGNRVAWFDSAEVTRAGAEASAAKAAAGVAACGWHAPESAGYSWEALAGDAVPPPRGADLTESLFLRWLDTAGITAPLVFLVAEGIPDATYSRGARRISFVPAARFGSV